MKRLVLLFALILIIPTTAFAQNDRRPGDGEGDRQRFIPIYQELLKDKSALYNKYGGGRRITMAVDRGESVQDTTLMRIILNHSQLQVEDAQLEHRYLIRLSGVLTPVQIYKLQKAEQKFKTSVMRRPQNRKK